MKAKVELADQVLEFLRRLAPNPRKAVRAGLHGLEEGRGDLKALEGDLAGYWRLRITKYRIIFSYATRAGQPVAQCVYAAERGIVYEIFSEQLRQQLLRRQK
jgi:mRNA interferase RelE/StbE